ncbi:uncharacterized protein LAESUDRAFT_757025 [Laetiporus sulphureus 93-53]|uniref:Cysteine protease n=1 Tax=Laetiporus sulphureus 93-53 TaxID=1314785 RepID=A0A165FEA5_9APHY|nr:uncharacterized protein LAESUDRAFT_757025 [Laetiporus sulphureus 93-53]KZT08838.1 hypothetical protein LAESUDRAFT_757025 [Laetiporus sulphureus 93-53]
MTSTGKSRSPSLSSSPNPAVHTPKLPKFLHKQRDRSKSLLDPNANSSAGSSTTSSSSSCSSPAFDTGKSRKAAKKVFGVRGDREQRRQSQDTNNSLDRVRSTESAGDEPPIIIEPDAEPATEPFNVPRTRAREGSISHAQSAYYPSSSSTSRLSDLPTRLSGWFSHTFSTSNTDLSLPSLLAQQNPGAPSGSPRKSSPLLTAARHGKGHLDKAMRYLLDSDATPDKCTEPIWLLGVEHPGYEQPPSPPPPTASASALNASLGSGSIVRRGSIESRHRSSSNRSSASSSPVVVSPDLTLPDTSSTTSQQSASKDASKDPSRFWPPVFYADFTSRIWLTYRSQFQPIRDTTLSALETEIEENVVLGNSPQPKRWNWSLGGEKGWTSDTGWGCMLRTGQSLLANALLHLHLGREWRRPPYPLYTVDYATYVQIITWFLDNPSPLSPFSVHRMALVGKELGKEVGQWFGPSTAAGAIKTLVHAFPEAGLGVSVASDAVIYQSDVYAASRSTMGSPRKHARSGWGDRAVLVLIGIRLGIDGVNPIYYDSVKALYTFPQSVGIAGGRPSSSYYFIGSQADNLFYLDPHHSRPAIPFKPPPKQGDPTPSRPTSPDSSDERDRNPRKAHHFRSPTTPNALRNSGSGFVNRPPTVPSPLQQQVSSSSNASSSSPSSTQSHARWQSSSAVPDDSEVSSLAADLNPVQRHYVTAYSQAELKTFHCDRVRKMPLSGLDPSMLIGFLCKNENDWLDFRRRISELGRTYKAMFYIYDEPPNWPSDSYDNIGLESFSEPDIDMPEEDNFSDRARSPSASPDTSVHGVGSKSEVDTEEDPIDPVTPGPGKSSFEIPTQQVKGEPEHDDPIDFDDEEDEEWMDPAPYPTGTPPELEPEPEMEAQATPSLSSPPQVHAPPMTQTLSTSSTLSTTSTGSKKRKKKKHAAKEKTPVPSATPVPLQYPFPATSPGEEPQQEANTKRVPQMRTAKARDGGRTQSGGIRGVPTDDPDDF